MTRELTRLAKSLAAKEVFRSLSIDQALWFMFIPMSKSELARMKRHVYRQILSAIDEGILIERYARDGAYP